MKQDQTEEIGKQAAALTLIELGLGSILHSFKIPLSGHVLSINQVALLSRTAFKLKSAKSSLQISFVASFLKSLSPAGKKLTPMLAIAAQGLLYYLGIILFGVNYLGLIAAVILSSLWAFIQPVLFIYLLFGKTSIDVAQYYLAELEKIVSGAKNYFVYFIVILILIKIVIALICSIIAIKMSDSEFQFFQKKIVLEIKMRNKQKTGSNFLLAIKDLMNPLFLVSLLLTIAFFIFSNSTLSHVQFFWMILRPFAVGFVLFYIVRVFPIEMLSSYLNSKGFIQLSKILDYALKTIRETNN